MRELFSSEDLNRLNLIILVLSAADIPYTVIRSNEGYSLYVEDEDVDTANWKMDAYFEENPEITSEPLQPSPPFRSTATGIVAAALLLVIHAAVIFHHATDAFLASFSAQADRIMSGEIHRAVTALMLHAGPVHLIGNLAGIAVFGTIVCTLTEAGPGWLMILLSGTFGNLANAAFYRTEHVSIGASTAIFGAIGILGAIGFWEKARSKARSHRGLFSIVSAFGLLAVLGTEGENSDIMAHLFGLLSGFFVGTIHTRVIRRTSPNRYTHGCWMISIGILAWAWTR